MQNTPSDPHEWYERAVREFARVTDRRTPQGLEKVRADYPPSELPALLAALSLRGIWIGDGAC